MDRLKEIFKIQERFTRRFFKEKYGATLEEIQQDKTQKIKWNKEHILAMIVEATEILNEIDWKMHKSMNSDEDREKILEESIDVMKFLFGMILLNGFNDEQVYKKFKQKSIIVEERFKTE